LLLNGEQREKHFNAKHRGRSQEVEADYHNCRHPHQLTEVLQRRRSFRSEKEKGWIVPPFV